MNVPDEYLWEAMRPCFFRADSVHVSTATAWLKLFFLGSEGTLPQGSLSVLQLKDCAHPRARRYRALSGEEQIAITSVGSGISAFCGRLCTVSLGQSYIQAMHCWVGGKVRVHMCPLVYVAERN